jgi:hypothetical protein
MRVLVAFLLVAHLQLPPTANAQKSQPAQQAQEAPKTMEPTPVTVNVTQVPSQAQKEKPQASSYDWPQICANWALVVIGAFAAFAAIKNLNAIEAQVIEMRKTGEQTDKLIKENIVQSEYLKRYVEETSRSAAAMEGVAKSLETTVETSAGTLQGLRKQMRAYLTVIIGGGACQNREIGLHFDGKPTILNTGLTPARNVRTRTKSAILPIPLPEDFDQSIAVDKEEGGSFIGAHQNAQVIAIVEDFVSDEQVENIKSGKGPGMYVWGFVTYEDVFGESHTTKFCQRLTWLPDGKVYGYYIPGHNDAD